MSKTPKHNLIPGSLRDLLEDISKLPDEHRLSLAKSVDRHTEFTMTRQTLIHKIHAAMGELRLQVKYLIFDIEATRRERDEARSK